MKQQQQYETFTIDSKMYNIHLQENKQTQSNNDLKAPSELQIKSNQQNHDLSTIIYEGQNNKVIEISSSYDNQNYQIDNQQNEKHTCTAITQQIPVEQQQSKKHLESIQKQRKLKKQEKKKFQIQKLGSLPKRVLRSSQNDKEVIVQGQNDILNQKASQEQKGFQAKFYAQSTNYKDDNTFQFRNIKDCDSNNTTLPNILQLDNGLGEIEQDFRYPQPNTPSSNYYFSQDEGQLLFNNISYERYQPVYQNQNIFLPENQLQLQQDQSQFFQQNLQQYMSDESINSNRQEQQYNKEKAAINDSSDQSGFNKKNLVRNIMASFKRFIECAYENDKKDLKSYLYQKTRFKVFLNDEQSIIIEENKKDILNKIIEIYNSNESSSEQTSPLNLLIAFKKYYDRKLYNYSTLQLLQSHRSFGPIFKYFLSNFFSNWVHNNKIMNPQSHLKMRDHILQNMVDA